MLAIPGFWPNVRAPWKIGFSHELRVLKMELYQLKKIERACIDDITWWEEFEHVQWTRTRE